MGRIYKSYTINIILVFSILHFMLLFKDLLNLFITRDDNYAFEFAFLFVPLSLLFILITCIGLIFEYLVYKTNQPNTRAFNFPYQKISCRPLYYIVFWASLIWAVFPVLFVIIALIYGLFT